VTRRVFPKTLVGRILVGSILAALLAAAGLAVLLVTLLSLRRSVDEEAHSNDTVAAALTLQSKVSSFESGLHGYLLTTDSRFLTSLVEARSELAPAQRQLATLVADDPVERDRVAALWSEVQSYLADYAEPLVQIARIDPSAVRSPVAVNEAKRRADSIESGFRGVVQIEKQRARARQRSVRAGTTRAIAAALVAAVLAILLIIALGRWVARQIAARLARATAAASEIATGKLTTRLDESGALELAELARAFNGMARSLEQSQRELLAQNARLLESEQQKSELITIVSHELRTPLTGLIGFTSLMLTRPFDDVDRTRYLEIIHRESLRLASIVDTFLDLRSIEDGRLELARQSFDLAALAEEQAGFLLAHAPAHDLSLELPGHEALVIADRDRLAQVVVSLISNAVKYSPAGGPIEVAVVDGLATVRLEVTDHGLGIPAADQGRIFTKFFRGQAVGQGIPGTGLGLAVAREIVEAHDGTIGFVSASQRGSTFWIELPKANGGGNGNGNGRVPAPAPAGS
jgi:signal transduction histidine kinase